VIFPRFRSRERDLRSDVERLSTIGAAVDRAIADADNEMVGLAARLDDARSRAAFLFGDVIDGEHEGGSTGIAMVADAERFLVRGERRREELARHRAVLDEIKQRIGIAIVDLSAESADP